MIIDQLKNLPGLENKQGNDVQRLAKLYREASRIAIKYCPMIVSHQCDSSVAGINQRGEKWSQHYIEMNQLEGSKIGIPGAADYIITMGFDYEYNNVRYLNVAKNRLTGKFIKAQVSFDAERARFSDE